MFLSSRFDRLLKSWYDFGAHLRKSWRCKRRLLATGTFTWNGKKCLIWRVPIMCRSNCPAPIPLGTPGDITILEVFYLSCNFYLVLPILITLIPSFSSSLFFFHFIFQCPAVFYQTQFFSDPGAAREGWGHNNLTSALPREIKAWYAILN